MTSKTRMILILFCLLCPAPLVFGQTQTISLNTTNDISPKPALTKKALKSKYQLWQGALDAMQEFSEPEITVIPTTSRLELIDEKDLFAEPAPIGDLKVLFNPFSRYQNTVSQIEGYDEDDQGLNFSLTPEVRKERKTIDFSFLKPRQDPRAIYDKELADKKARKAVRRRNKLIKQAFTNPKKIVPHFVRQLPFVGRKIQQGEAWVIAQTKKLPFVEDAWFSGNFKTDSVHLPNGKRIYGAMFEFKWGFRFKPCKYA